MLSYCNTQVEIKLMKRILTGAIVALIAMPAAAQSASGGERAAAQARPTLERPALERPAPERVAPVLRTGDDNKAAYIAALRAAHNRAKNAVANGADPARVRSKLQAYKQQLRRRWNATH